MGGNILLRQKQSGENVWEEIVRLPFENTHDKDNYYSFD